MIKVIAFYEDHWMPPGTDAAQWDHLCRAYGADLQMIRDWDEAYIPEGAHIYLLDEAGALDLSRPEDILHAMELYDLDGLPEAMVLVFGRTAQDLTLTVPEFTNSFKITTPNAVSMFGVCAGAIALYSIHLIQQR